jgi:hypothetical protein
VSERGIATVRNILAYLRRVEVAIEVKNDALLVLVERNVALALDP